MVVDERHIGWASRVFRCRLACCDLAFKSQWRKNGSVGVFLFCRVAFRSLVSDHIVENGSCAFVSRSSGFVSTPTTARAPEEAIFL